MSELTATVRERAAFCEDQLRRCGFILGNGRCEVYLDRSAPNGTEFALVAATVSGLVPNEVRP